MKKLILIFTLCCAISTVYAEGGITGRGTVTPTIALVTETGTVPAGTKSLTFIFSQDFAGTVLGVAFVGGTDATVSLAAPDGDTMSEVTYTVTAGSFRLIKIK